MVKCKKAYCRRILILSEDIYISISESGDKNALAYKNKTHVRGEFILLSFSILKLKYFTYF